MFRRISDLLLAAVFSMACSVFAIAQPGTELIDFHETPGTGIENRSVEISGEVDIFHSHVFAPVSDGFFDEFFHTSPAHNDDIFGQSDMVAVEGTASLDEIIVPPLPAVGEGIKHVVPHVNGSLGSDFPDFISGEDRQK